MFVVDDNSHCFQTQLVQLVRGLLDICSKLRRQTVINSFSPERIVVFIRVVINQSIVPCLIDKFGSMIAGLSRQTATTSQLFVVCRICCFIYGDRRRIEVFFEILFTFLITFARNDMFFILGAVATRWVVRICWTFRGLLSEAPLAQILRQNCILIC